MNLYLILAIAFGISGVTNTPVSRNGSSVVTVKRAEARVAIRTNSHVILSREDGEGPQNATSLDFVPVGCTPLAGAATPRAPAVTC